MLDRLFVYGSLRRGQPNPWAAKLEESATWQGPARTRGRLYRVAAYPGMLAPAQTDDWVSGELYQLRDTAVFDELDAYEGEDYVRAEWPVEMPGGETIDAWVYLYCSMVDEDSRIPSGDFPRDGSV